MVLCLFGGENNDGAYFLVQFNHASILFLDVFNERSVVKPLEHAVRHFCELYLNIFKRAFLLEYWNISQRVKIFRVRYLLAQKDFRLLAFELEELEGQNDMRLLIKDH